MCTKILGALLIVIVVAGCSSTHMKSNVDPEFSASIDRLYLLIGRYKTDISYSLALKDELVKLLRGDSLILGFQCFEQRAPSFTDLNEGPTIDTIDIRRFEPDGILLIQEVYSQWNQGFVNSSVTKVNQDISLYLADDEKRAWRASVETGATPFVSDKLSAGSMKKVARSIVKQMKADGVLE